MNIILVTILASLAPTILFILLVYLITKDKDKWIHIRFFDLKPGDIIRANGVVIKVEKVGFQNSIDGYYYNTGYDKKGNFQIFSNLVNIDILNNKYLDQYKNSFKRK